MTMLTTAVPRDEARAPFDRSNPLARLGAASLLAVPNLVALDPFLAGASVVVSLGVVLGASDLSRRFVTRAVALAALAAAAAGVANALGAVTGEPSQRLTVAALTAARIMAVVLPGLLAFATVDPVDAADSAVVQLRVPVRVAYGVLAAVRLTPQLAVDWRTMADAERARGVVRPGPVAALARTGRRTAGLLVSATRRASRTAVALDARGFDLVADHAAVDSPWRPSDWAWVLGATVTATGLGLLAMALPGGRLVLVG